MASYSGEVLGGKVIIEGDPPPDGTRVEICVVEGDGEMWLPSDMEDEIVEASAELNRGEGVPAEQVLVNLQKRKGELPSP